MKKLKPIIIFFVFILIMIGVFKITYHFFGPAQKQSFVTTKFDKPIYDTIWGRKKGSYSTFIYSVKGFTNDTIKIGFDGYVKLSGQIDEVFMGDFFGGYHVFYFTPYKATEGKIEVVHEIF